MDFLKSLKKRLANYREKLLNYFVERKRRKKEEEEKILKDENYIEKLLEKEKNTFFKKLKEKLFSFKEKITPQKKIDPNLYTIGGEIIVDYVGDIKKDTAEKVILSLIQQSLDTADFFYAFRPYGNGYIYYGEKREVEWKEGKYPIPLHLKEKNEDGTYRKYSIILPSGVFLNLEFKPDGINATISPQGKYKHPIPEEDYIPPKYPLSWSLEVKDFTLYLLSLLLLNIITAISLVASLIFYQKKVEFLSQFTSISIKYQKERYPKYNDIPNFFKKLKEIRLKVPKGCWISRLEVNWIPSQKKHQVIYHIKCIDGRQGDVKETF